MSKEILCSFCVIFCHDSLPQGAVAGVRLRNSHLVGTTMDPTPSNVDALATFNPNADSIYALCSLALVYLMPMQVPLVQGSVLDQAVITQFSSMAAAAPDWIQAVKLCHNQSGDLKIFFSIIAVQETTYVHPCYKQSWGRSSDPSTVQTVRTHAPETAAWFNLVSTTLGLPSLVPIGRTSATPVAAALAPYVSTVDRESSTKMDNLEARLTAIFIAKDI